MKHCKSTIIARRLCELLSFNSSQNNSSGGGGGFVIAVVM